MWSRCRPVLSKEVTGAVLRHGQTYSACALFLLVHLQHGETYSKWDLSYSILDSIENLTAHLYLGAEEELCGPADTTEG